MFKTGENGGLSIRNSSQFSLEVIIHNKLKTNRLRTWNPDETDIFYIPAYFALLFLCNENQTETLIFIKSNVDHSMIKWKYLVNNSFLLHQVYCNQVILENHN
jgi:hypothetical protein